MPDSIQQVFAMNAKYFCEKQGKKVSDLEAYIGAKEGFLLAARESKRIMNLDRAYKISKFLDRNLGDLVDENIATKCKIEELKSELKYLEGIMGENND